MYNNKSNDTEKVIAVTIEKINFKNVNVGHFIEMDASANVSVTGCTFKSFRRD